MLGSSESMPLPQQLLREDSSVPCTRYAESSGGKLTEIFALSRCLASTFSHWPTRKSSMQTGPSLQETSDSAHGRNQASFSRTYPGPGPVDTEPFMEKKKKSIGSRGKEKLIAKKVHLVPQLRINKTR